jgi:hypothetical protein
VLACAAPATGGCSLLLPWDELTGPGGPADAGHVEASDVEVQEAAATDRDAPSDSPGETEAASDGGYPEGSWCAKQAAGAAFCDDFDFETTSFERWSSHEFQIGGSARFSTVAESPPHAFELTSGPITPSTYYLEVLQESVPPRAGATSISLSFAFEPALAWDAGGGQEMNVATISQGPGAPRSDVWLQLGPYGAVLLEQVTGADGGTSFPRQSSSGVVPNPGHWTHVVLAVDFASLTANVTLDGVSVATISSLQGQWSAAAQTNVYLGNWYVPATPGFDVLYDDAVIRQQP